MPTTCVANVNWASNVTYGATRIHRPRTLDQVRRTVGRSERIRALGSGHSFSLVADTTGELMRLDGLPRTVRIDPARSTVTLSAGLRYAELAGILHRAGYALANLASLPHISVAGSCATGTHGSGDTQRCLAASVAGLRLVGPEGDLTELRRDTDPHTFAGSVVALGALGIVTELTLDIEPAYEMTQRVRVAVPLDEVADRPDAVFGAAYSVSVFTDWRSGTAQVWLKARTDDGSGAGAVTGWNGGRAAARPVHPVPGMPPEFSTEQLGTAGPWYARLPHFRPELTPGAGEELQSEYFLPRDAAPAAFAAIRALAGRVAPVLHIAEVRTVRADDLWLSPAYGRDTVTFHFTWIKELPAVLPVISAVEEALMPLGARPHWAKLTTVPASRVVPLYERSPEFEQLLRKYDPAGKFRNAFVDSLFPTG
ncbi:D-arabinono-1,4-lactone oxidase [Streptomyces sp. MST-110588]|uniref:D-arabinono-1,4-lactone oxidase n=1 Tax=Streptomyces sp. MST-110588 TaxID=2833628 RepID=UPI001F5E2920|nr:D-arabinono-1,4-lactone oxidase [Streptomyces sp. MST-110588]UNO39200.1 FAD-binding protein [Streptomyces sp. MST-110588]